MLDTVGFVSGIMITIKVFLTGDFLVPTVTTTKLHIINSPKSLGQSSFQSSKRRFRSLTTSRSSPNFIASSTLIEACRTYDSAASISSNRSMDRRIWSLCQISVERYVQSFLLPYLRNMFVESCESGQAIGYLSIRITMPSSDIYLYLVGKTYLILSQL